MQRRVVAPALLLLWLASLFAAPAQAQKDCQPVNFAPGQSTVELSGTAPPDGVVCFALTGLTGQDVSVAVSQGANIIFSIDGLIDAQARYRFNAAQDRYRILAGQLMRSIDAEPFRIRVSLNNGQEGAPNRTSTHHQSGRSQ